MLGETEEGLEGETEMTAEEPDLGADEAVEETPDTDATEDTDSEEPDEDESEDKDNDSEEDDE
jgi:hypothetical protein